jgi:hypothetical protein
VGAFDDIASAGVYDDIPARKRSAPDEGPDAFERAAVAAEPYLTPALRTARAMNPAAVLENVGYWAGQPLIFAGSLPNAIRATVANQRGEKYLDPKQALSDTQEYLAEKTYLEPETEGGKDLKAAISKPFEWLGEGSEWLGHGVADVARFVGLPDWISEGAGAVTEAAGQVLPMVAGGKAISKVGEVGRAADVPDYRDRTGSPESAAPIMAPGPSAKPVPVVPPPKKKQTVAEQMQEIRPTGAFEDIPETPVEGAGTPRPPTEPAAFEPKPGDVPDVPRHAVEGVAVVPLQVDSLKLSEDVPQFKAGANEKGVVAPLGGTFDPVGVAPIQVWERLNGDREVISGRHRLDLAERSGRSTIDAQVHREADGFDAKQATSLDAILNIRDEQGSAADYASYFKNAEVTEAAADAAGLLARSKGRTGFTIARDASPDTFAAHSAGVISDEAARAISEAAPGNAAVQNIGLKMVQEGKPITLAQDAMRSAEVAEAKAPTDTEGSQPAPELKGETPAAETNAKEAGTTDEQEALGGLQEMKETASPPLREALEKHEEAAKPMSVGMMPNDTEPITVKNGVVYIGKYEAVNYETGEVVKVPEGASPAEIKEALVSQGAIAPGMKVFGVPKIPMGKNHKQTGAVIPDMLLGPVAKVAEEAGAKAREIIPAFVEEAQMAMTPMSARSASNRARAIAKDFANSERLARAQWSKFDDLLKKNYPEARLKEMWEAGNQEDEILRSGKKPGENEGLNRLTPDERKTMQALTDYGNELLGQAKQLGMMKGEESVKYWVPRMVALIGEDGEVSLPKRKGEQATSGDVGSNVKVSADSLKRRKHETAAGTEAAAKQAFGQSAGIVRNIRTMPLAMARLERAITGRRLINEIKRVGKETAQETVVDSEKPGYFTVDHPAFKTYGPRLKQVDGKWQAVKDADGNTVIDRKPLYVAKEFQGPLKSILSSKDGEWYKGMMALKGKTMGLIMYSPLIHNMVEWGRALPMMPGKVASLRIYFEGNKAKNDWPTMRRAILNGMSPIGKRAAMQDISGIIEDPTLKPGRSITAKVAGGTVGLVNKAAGEAVKKGIDYAGDVWHNKLLWDRVADLQMGLYVNIERDLIGKGMDPVAAGKVAAHFANRYAGALPNEAMSAMARKVANFSLFSRTFTLGNIGVIKDMVTGLPKDVQAQIIRDAGVVANEAAKSAARRKAILAFGTDIALLYAGNSLLQSVLDKWKRDKSWSEIEQGYVDRFDKAMKRIKESPTDLLNPASVLQSLTPGSENEPGKENRVFFDYDQSGTGIYVRLPTGKIGEEFLDWTGLGSNPLDILKRKEGTILKPLLQTYANDKGFGQRVWNPDTPGFKGVAKALGNIAWNFLSQQAPVDSIESAANMARGKSEESDAMKVIGPLLGVTFSKGAAGGPALGELYKGEQKHRSEIAEVMPDIKKAVKNGDWDKAYELMNEAHMNVSEQRLTLKYALIPQSRLTPRRLSKFYGAASQEDQEKMNDLRGRQ